MAFSFVFPHFWINFCWKFDTTFDNMGGYLSYAWFDCIFTFVLTFESGNKSNKYLVYLKYRF